MVTIAHISPFGQDNDCHFMRQALEQAHQAFQANEVPIGAVVVNSQGAIIAQAHNRVEQEKTQAAHAEVLALRQASKAIGDWRLTGCWVYVTLEPCSMCIALIRLSRCTGVIYGAASPLFGYRLDNDLNFQVYKEDPLLHAEGLLADESAQLLKAFFDKKRKKA